MEQRLHRPLSRHDQWFQTLIIPFPMVLPAGDYRYVLAIRRTPDHPGFDDCGPRACRAEPLLTVATDDGSGRMIAIQNTETVDLSWVIPASDMGRFCRGSYEGRVSVTTAEASALVARLRFVVA